LLARAGIDDQDLVAGELAEGLERTGDLAFLVQRVGQLPAERWRQADRKVGHGRQVYGRHPTTSRPVLRGGSRRGTIRRMLERIRAMPTGIRIFLVYAFLILAGIGISLPWVVDQAIGAPVSGTGVVVMVLLAYTIFTTTLVLQRKEASRNLAIGLASLTVPLLIFLAVSGLLVQTIFVGALAILLFRGLRAPDVRAYLTEP
jgi:hypothetical protein